MHLDTTIWGADAAEFKPTRWLDDTGNIITPAKGTFLPWSGGPRVCPGMKFSQVEFVAVFATLFRSAKCAPLLKDGETGEEARKRLENIMTNSVSKLTLQVKNPKDVMLKWVKE
jgi:cytochrome P450